MKIINNIIKKSKNSEPASNHLSVVRNSDYALKDYNSDELEFVGIQKNTMGEAFGTKDTELFVFKVKSEGTNQDDAPNTFVVITV